MDMNIQHGRAAGRAARTGTCSTDMQQGHRHAAWTCCKDMQRGRTAWR
jgi:hypothetical protein